MQQTASGRSRHFIGKVGQIKLTNRAMAGFFFAMQVLGGTVVVQLVVYKQVMRLMDVYHQHGNCRKQQDKESACCLFHCGRIYKPMNKIAG